MLSRFLLPTLVVGLAAPAFAQKPAPVHPLEVGTDPIVAVADDGVTYLDSQRPAFEGQINALVAPGAPEDQARAFLAQRGGVIGLRTTDASDLKVERVRDGLAGTNVRFRQTVGGVPVWGPETVVTIDHDDRVQALANGYRDDLEVTDLTPAITADAARAAVFAHIGLTGEPTLDEVELMVWPSTPARLAWVTRTAAYDVPGDWEGVIDAHTGEILRIADRRVYHAHDDNDRPGPTALPLAEMSPSFRVDGAATIFDPDPLTTAGVLYGGQYVDANDSDVAVLNAQRVPVTLRDITFDGTNYRLVGPWAEIRELESPNRGLFAQPSPDFSITRAPAQFEGALVYWHIDNYMRYVNVELGIDATPQAYSTGVRFDAHGVGGADNSYFSSGSDIVVFGEGCVDDSEDADVVIHELGHGLHDWLSAISNINGDGLSEGFGDYVAVSYTRSLGLLQPSDAAYNWVFKWDGHNPCWPGRTAGVTFDYPAGGGLHGVGQNWSTANMRVWDQIGREQTDRAVFEGIAMTNSQTRQPAAAQAVLQAAANMGYPQSEIDIFFDSYVQQDYDPTPVITAEDEAAAEAAGVFVSAASPNPFNGLTTLDVMVDRPQAVTVEVFDAVGRQVATLFAGEMTAGQRFPMSLDSADLRSGVYIVRVTGESVATTRRVTVVR